MLKEAKDCKKDYRRYGNDDQLSMPPEQVHKIDSRVKRYLGNSKY